MQALLAAGIPVASSCAGKAVCAKCKLAILNGQDNLSEPNEDELFLKEQVSLSASERISCQVRVFGDVTIDASYW